MSREDDMVTLRVDEQGRPTVFCDPEIADLVDALNSDAAGVSTVASCSGHGHRPGSIVLKDGRVLSVFPSLSDWQAAEQALSGLYPNDINGDPVQAHQVAGCISGHVDAVWVRSTTYFHYYRCRACGQEWKSLCEAPE